MDHGANSCLQDTTFLNALGAILMAKEALEFVLVKSMGATQLGLRST